MPRFSENSRSRLLSCHPTIIRVFSEAIKLIDFSVICGFRGEAEQNRAYDQGYSQVRYPHSKHNSDPSLAIDIAMWHQSEPHIHWDSPEEFIYLAGHIMACAGRFDTPLIWGGDWNADNQWNQSFYDYGHFELAI